MGGIIGKFTLIIVVNLFAFMTVGYILDLIFDSGNSMKIVMLMFSVISLVLISNTYFKNALTQLEEIRPIKEDIEKNTNTNHTK